MDDYEGISKALIGGLSQTLPWSKATSHVRCLTVVLNGQLPGHRKNKKGLHAGSCWCTSKREGGCAIVAIVVIVVLVAVIVILVMVIPIIVVASKIAV